MADPRVQRVPQANKQRQESGSEGECMNVTINAMVQTVTTMLTTVGLKISVKAAVGKSPTLAM